MAKKEIIQIDNNLVTGLAPHGGLSFHRNKISLGENFVKVYTFIKYPPFLRRGWASKISNMPNVTMCQMFEPCDNSALIADLSKSVAKYNGIAETTRFTRKATSRKIGR